MRQRGKYLVLGILLLAAVLAVGNMIYQTRASLRVVDHWGDSAAERIIAAEKVEVLRLAEKPRESAETLEAGNRRFSVTQRADASHAPGLVHVRRALVSDGLYDWSAPESPAAAQWHYALRFRDGDEEFTLLLDDACLVVAALNRPARPLRVIPNKQAASPLKAFVEEQLAAR